MARQAQTLTAVRSVPTPLGVANIAATARGVCRLALDEEAATSPTSALDPAAEEHCERAERALREYFAGERSDFGDLELDPEGTDFQRRVWNALLEIPFGVTRSYGELAQAVGSPGAARAVGLANGSNPLWIVIPCHRVIGSDGSLTGYGGGLDRKRWLLEHEGAVLC